MNARERVLREADAELLAPTGTGGLTGAVNSWDLSTGVDGPGTRFVVFTGGCPLRCLYCENPETWRMRGSPRTTVDELMAEIAKYRRFISVAGGGVTISGGEPLLQPAFTAEILHRCHTLGLHTALDTSGYLGDRADDALLADTDLVLLDIKAWTPALYRRLTGRDLAPTLRFAERLAELREPVWVRYVLVPGFTDAPEEVEGVASFVAALPNVEHVDVLPFHRLGAAKYQRLGIPFPLAEVEPPTAELVARIRSEFRAHGVTAR
ncbi:pyruvate formate-lyase-activating protein [Actinomadura madurae]|uniref:pyruvate formate-lyase-activating protein n=1 Tax=Actinomadura madurae TaxID=1993 RepID=UPI0020D25C5E|nr:pyruvate formate-lyase-activating protein [Actinomadura madurae]MCP9948952.1 pyruvate formate-lyase-activating protein [Actinomadura madurae]MCP9965725.1 pyruvate formate-lyase-activating protein [Actinomadura madurae]MCP9978199.1 pyruvate formate-lyase-activating protein [Actinomadura madurae]MCQ0010284.1 pyruvate formate-lyase-activating protein [Actinomadura madurae]MCQ0014404.1 pyruvate formate-lyase-activating protein [Actinomadura madurae]